MNRDSESHLQEVALAGEPQQAYLQQVPPMQTPPQLASIEMMTFMHGMQQQMQFSMQGLQQQFAAQQPVQGHHAGAISHSRLDERCFRRLGKFTNRNDDWKEWRLHLLTFIGECNSRFDALFWAQDLTRTKRQ